MVYDDQEDDGFGTVEIDHSAWAVLWPILVVVGIIGVAAGVALGQGTYTLATPAGPIVGQLVPSGGGALEVRHRNGSGSDSWGLASQPAGQPVAFSRWQIDAPPGYTLLMGGLFGARQLGPSSFLMADAGDWKLPARRNGVDLWPATAGYHRILPGDTLYARVVPASDPWETGYLASVLTPERRAAALAVMAFDEARIARWPWLAKYVDRAYLFDAACLNPATPAGQRWAGWLLVPGNFMVRWPFYLGSTPAGSAACRHWYGLGSRSAVQGENLNNEHYRAAACWLGCGMRRNDPASITVGLYLLRAKCAYGLVDCDPAHIDKGKWRNEKGDLARGTTGTRPDRAKEYDRDLAMAEAAGFTATEPLLGRSAALRKASLLGPDWAWSGSGGARMLGHYLENLRDWSVATGDDRFRARAQLEIDHAMTIVGARPYFVDDPAHEKVSGGEGLCALASCRWWALHGAGANHQAKLDAMLAWYQAKLYSGGQTAYYAVVNPDGTVTWQANAEFGSLNWLQVPGLSQAVRDGIERHCFTKYANVPTCDATYGGEGPGWEKFVPWIVGWGGTSE